MSSEIKANSIQDKTGTRVLASDSGSAWSWGSGVPTGSLVLLDTDTANNTVDNYVYELSAGYLSYRVEIISLRPASDDTSIHVALGTSSSSFSTSNYRFNGYLTNYDGSSTNHTAQSNNQNFLYATSVGNDPNYGVNGSFVINNALNSAISTIGFGHISWFSTTNQLYNFPFSTARTDTETNTHFKVYTAGGNFTSGTINLYGIK